MPPRQVPLSFDPIDEAARQWGLRWDRVPAMHAVTSLMRVQQLVIGRLDAILRPHGLTFARYEALVLLVFCRPAASIRPLGVTLASYEERELLVAHHRGRRGDNLKR